MSKIDHMKLDTTGAIKKIFGTTRNVDFLSKGSLIHVFIVTLDSNFNLDSVETLKKLDIAENDSYVTGIDNSIASS